MAQCGCDPIAKTKSPQTILIAESDDNVFGQAKNLVVSHLTVERDQSWLSERAHSVLEPTLEDLSGVCHQRLNHQMVTL